MTQSQQFQNQVVLITGAANGIGASVATMLHDRGAHVYLTDIDTERGIALSKTLKNSHFSNHDTRDKRQWEQVLNDCVARFGKITGLVNNAGIAISELLNDATDESYDKQMDINVKGVYYGCKFVIPFMSESGGAIVNISSIASLQGAATLAIYCASKGAVSALTRAVAAECSLGQLDIRCNAVCPGIIDTNIWHDILDEAPLGQLLQERATAMGNNDPVNAAFIAAANTPGGKLGKPKDIAGAVCFLLSSDAGYVNGECMYVDNGMTN